MSQGDKWPDGRPPILYKYLDAEGANNFLKEPQIRYKDFTKLDDVCDSIPAFSELTDEEAHQNAIERARRTTAPSVSRDKKVSFFKALGKISSAYLEQEYRDLLENAEVIAFVCSLAARNDSLPLWSLYAESHHA